LSAVFNPKPWPPQTIISFPVQSVTLRLPVARRLALHAHHAPRVGRGVVPGAGVAPDEKSFGPCPNGWTVGWRIGSPERFGRHVSGSPGSYAAPSFTRPTSVEASPHDENSLPRPCRRNPPAGALGAPGGAHGAPMHRRAGIVPCTVLQQREGLISRPTQRWPAAAMDGPCPPSLSQLPVSGGFARSRLQPRPDRNGGARAPAVVSRRIYRKTSWVPSFYGQSR